MIGKRNLNDPRNSLFKEYLRVVKYLKPSFFVLENVKGLLTMDNGKVKEKIIAEFSKIGYTIDYKVINAADYGVPQLRERVFFMGNLFGEENDFPIPTHSIVPTKKNKAYETVKSAFKGLNKTFKNHVAISHNDIVVERIKLTPEGEKLPTDKLPTHLKFGSRSDFKDKKIKNFANVFRRLHRDKPAITMVPGHNAFPIHPTENRSLTVREAARLQTLPDHLEITGSRQNQCIQVGNAVPTKLAEVIGTHLISKLKNKAL